MKQALLQCMGGWCDRRETCAHFNAPPNGRPPVERLCAPGKDEPYPFIVIREVA